MPNAYSADWYEIFLDSIPAPITDSEISFVERQLPRAEFPFLLDLCCGSGRHAAELSNRGYDVLGIDRNESAIRRARASCPQARFEVRDMRDIRSIDRAFDAVLNFWHSFGYFDDETNTDVLRQMCELVRPGGKAIVDLYNRDYFAGLPDQELAERGGRRIRTRRSWKGLRHHIRLDYDDAPGDEFEWRLYSPEEFSLACSWVGLDTELRCAWFDESRAPSAEHARMQFVLKRGV